MNTEQIVKIGQEVVGEQTEINRGSQYINWLDSKPDIFMTFREWMYCYHETEHNKRWL